MIVFTGGTTLTPKGVRLSHGALAAYLDGIVAAVRPHAVESFVADTPQQILLGLLLGQKVWVPTGHGKNRLRSVGGLLATGDPDMFFGPPSTWVALLRLAEAEGLPSPTGLKLVLLGGAPVSRAALSGIRDWIPKETDIRVLYGLTEVGPACVCRAQTRIGWNEEGNLVGEPLPGVEIEIDSGEADSDVGEIVLRAPSLYSGYLGETVVDPIPVLRTGDLGRLVTLEGRKHLVLMGRKKDMIIRRGVNLYPPSIEPIVEDLRDAGGRRLVEECSLIGVWDKSCEDEVVVLCFVPARDDHSGQLRDEVSEILAHQLGREAMPDALISMSQLPTVGRQQKPDKRALRRLAAAELGLEAYSAVTQEPM